MKKVNYLLLCLVLLITFVMYGTAMAQNGEIALANVNAAPGNEIPVGINISSNPGVAGLDFIVNYDPEVLNISITCNETEDGDVICTNVEPVDFDPWVCANHSSGKVRCVWDSNKNVRTTGEILRLNFTVLDTASSGKSTLSISDFMAFKANENPVNFNTTNGSVTVQGIEASVEGFSGTYDGSSHGITVTVTEPTDYQIKYGTTEGSYTLDASPEYTNAGTNTVYYQVTATGYKPLTDSATVTINKAASEVTTVPTAAVLTYNGGDQALLTAGAATGGAMVYSLTADGEFSETLPVGKDANTYTAYYKVKGDANHSDTEVAGPVNVTIAPKEVGLSWSGTSFTFNGSEQAPTATATGLEPGDSCTVTVSGGQTNAGSYTATADSLSNTNYKLPTVATTQFTIGKAAAQTLADVTMNQIYSRTDVSTSISDKMPSNAGTLSYTPGTVTKTGSVTVSNFAVSESGALTATLSNGAIGNEITFPVTISSTNYEDSSLKVVVTLTDKEEAGVTITEGPEISKVYGESLTLSTTVSATGENGSWTWSSDDESTATVSNAGVVTVKAVGETTLTAEYESDTTAGSASIKLTVTQKEVGLSWGTTSFTFNGNEQAPTATVTTDSLVGSDNCTVTVTGGQTNVGTYTATAVSLDNDNYKLPTANTTQFEIKAVPAAVETAPTPNNLTYNGNDQTLVSGGTATGGTMVYSLSADGTFAETLPVGKGADTYTAYYKVHGDANHSDSEVAGPVNVTIAQKEVGLSWGETSFTFNGSEQAPIATATDLASGDTCTVTVTGGQTDAGSYTATATSLSNTNYKLPTAVTTEFKIVKAAAQTLADVAKTQVYTKADVSVSVSGKMPEKAEILSYTAGTASVNGSASVSGFGVDANGNVTATLSGGQIDDVITLPVTISSQNYEDSSIKVVVTLTAKEDAGVSLSGDSEITKTYGDSLTLSASASNTGENGSWSWSSSSTTVASVDNTGVVTINTVGEATITAAYSSDTTYGEATVKLTVEKKEVGLSWGETSFTFNGSEQAPTATATDLVGSDSCTVTVTGGQTNKGTYTATASSLSNSNYKLPAENTVEFRIAGKAMNVSAQGYNGEYDAASHSITVTVTDPVNGIVEYSEDGTNYSTTNPAYTDTGSYTVWYRVTADNYETATGSAAVDISQKEIEVEDESPEVDVPFDGSAHSVTVTAKEPADAKVEYSENGTDYSETNPQYTESGTYKVFYRITANNYKTKEGFATLSIRGVKASAADVRKVIDGNAYGITVTVIEPANAEVKYGTTEGNYTLDESPTYSELGEYTVFYEVIDPTGEYGPFRSSAKVSILEPMQLNVKFTNVKSDGSYNSPDDIKEQTVNLTVKLENDQAASEATFELALSAGAKEFTVENVEFDNRVDDIETPFKVAVEGLPESVEVDIYSASGAAVPKYGLSYQADAWYSDKDTVTITLRWSNNTPASGGEEEKIVVYNLPEDEIGAYKLLNDGTKEYLLFHTYDICMRYLGRDELCRGPERCFHKEHPYVNPFVK